MKIGILGNINNIYFSLARYLADEGYDCTLMLFDYEPEHFHPSADSFRKEFNFSIKQLSWGDPAQFLQNKEQVKNDLAPFEFLIGNGTSPAFVNNIGRTLDLFIPYGDDLYMFPFQKIVHPKRQIAYLVFSWQQRQGILKCKHLLFDKASPRFEKVFQRIGFRNNRIVSPLPLFYHKEYDVELGEEEANNPFLPALKKLRAENELLIIQHARQHWKTKTDEWSRKGNNYLLEGFAAFLKRNGGVKANLILFEYGTDVNHSKKLVAGLGLENNVTWFPKMHRKHLLYIIKVSDLVVGELFHSWNSYCVVLEALYMGKPVMHKRDDKDLLMDYKQLYPMLYASGSQSVLEGLEIALRNKEKMLAMGAAGKNWFFEYCVDRPLNEIRQLIEAKKNSKDVQAPA